MKRIFSTLLLLIICTTFFAQNLEKMNENERVNTLLRIAKEGVIKYGPDYYREYGKPEIKYNCVVDSNKNFADEDIEKYRNKYYYSVKYNYDKSKNLLIPIIQHGYLFGRIQEKFSKFILVMDLD